MRKKVYVIGAGFSALAGLPVQSKILPRIRDFSYFSDSPTSPELIRSWIDDLAYINKFFKELFPKAASPNLEDVFTLLDYAIESEGNVKNFDWQSLVKARDSLNRLILAVFYPGVTMNQDAYNCIASKFVRSRVVAKQKSDPLSVISVNWDSLLEDSIYNCIKAVNKKGKIDVDYCCRTAVLEGVNSPHLCSLNQKAKGRYNIKVVKLHGSMNWLICPACNILYTGLGSDRSQGELYLRDRYCSKCAETGKKIKLNHFFITPTFLKTFTNPHVKMTWYNAFIELSEASEVVFIGYSFPISDYHFRALLRSALSPEAKITVVLAPDVDPRKFEKKSREFLPTARYKDFFCSNKLVFDYGGIQSYFKLNSQIRSAYNRNLSTIRKSL